MNAAIAVLLPFLCLPSTINGALFRSGENAGYNENDMIVDKGRHLLSIGGEALECLIKTDVMLSNEGLGQLSNLISGSRFARLWKLPLEPPFCKTTVPVDGVTKCDVRRLSRDIIDFDLMKSICESDDVGGEFIEFDMRVSESIELYSPNKREIKHIPMCLDRSACPNGMEMTSLNVMVWDVFNSYPDVVRSDGCDEVATDNFFVKFQEGEPVIRNCDQLSKNIRQNYFPDWMSNKHPCLKKLSPAGQPGPARTVCPVTCKQEMCDEDPERVFLKNIPTPITKTCRWLSNQDSTKQKKLCARSFYRKEGFPSTPSAYSACPDTCSQFKFDDLPYPF